MSSGKVLKVAYVEDSNAVLAAVWMGFGRRWMWFLEIEIMWWVEWRGMVDSEQWTMLYGPGVGFVDDDGNYRFGFFFRF